MPVKYPMEFKHQVIQQYQKGESVKNHCQERHIAQSTINLWRKFYYTIQTPQRTYTPKEFDSISQRFEKPEHKMKIIRASGFF